MGPDPLGFLLDPDLDEVSVSFKRDRMCIKYRFPNGPYSYMWLNIQQ